MTTTTTKTSELNAVNTMLSYLGSPPVASLTSNANADALIAKQILNEVSREVQSEGWHWNSEEGKEYALNVDDEIEIPDNVLRLDYKNRLNDYIERNGRLYNRKTRTYTFTDAVALDVVYLLEWSDLPEPARNYIMHRAASQLLLRLDRDGGMIQAARQGEAESRVRLERYEASVGDHNILNNGPGLHLGLHRRSYGDLSY